MMKIKRYDHERLLELLESFSTVERGRAHVSLERLVELKTQVNQKIKAVNKNLEKDLIDIKSVFADIGMLYRAGEDRKESGLIIEIKMLAQNLAETTPFSKTDEEIEVLYKAWVRKTNK